MSQENYLRQGQIFLNRFQVEKLLGAGYEGEVYRVTELYTQKTRAIKLFYPARNPKFKVSTRNAITMDKLRESSLVMDCLSHEIVKIKSQKVACLVLEFVEGETLHNFMNLSRQKRISIFPAIHLLYSIVLGVEAIHSKGEYHGDLHVDNVIIQKFGLNFELKIIDFHHWGDSKKANREEDIIKIIRIFYDILGGVKYYSKLPDSIKYIIAGLKRGLILSRFRTISDLRLHIESMDWSDAINS